jgi:hypothetical protein
MAADNIVTPIGNRTDDPEVRSERAVQAASTNAGGSHEWNR